MKNITGEIAIRTFFGGNTKNLEVNGRSVNQEITYLFLDAFEWVLNTLFLIKVALVGYERACKWFVFPHELKIWGRYEKIANMA